MNQPYYLLTDTALTTGATLRQDDDEASGTDYITTAPRLIPFSEITDLGLVELFGVNAKHDLRLALLEPLGEVAADPPGRCFRRCEQGWKVVVVEPIDTVFGSQARLIRDSVDRAERILNWDEDKAISDRFVEATNRGWAEIEQAQEAAEKAMDAVGIPGWSWGCVGGDVYGYVYVGLAARHLVGITPEWTAEAYAVLTRPWAEAFGTPIHPDDALSEVSK